MGPRFSDPLYFEQDGALEVCGPANFGPNDISFELLKITIIDHEGNSVQEEFDPPILVGSGELMWESEIDDARSRLVVGPARGIGKGRVRRRDHSTQGVGWADQFQLIDPATYLEDTAGG